MVLLLVERAPLHVEAVDGNAILIESDGVENDLFTRFDLDVAGKYPDPRYPLLSVLLRLDLLWSGAAMCRRALTILTPLLSRGADVRQVFIAKPLRPGRPSTGMPPETPVMHRS